MKNYNQFLNEKNYRLVLPDDKFAIDVKNNTDSEKKEIISKFEKYFEIDNDVKNEMTDKERYKIPWAWIFTIYNSSHYRPSLNVSFVTTPNWGAGYDYMSDIITGKEFLEVGFEGVEYLISKKKEKRLMKQNVNKFNI